MPVMDMERIYELLDMPARRREALADARTWLLDCFSEEHEVEEIKLLNAVRLVQSIETHYEGGWEQFLLDGALL